MRIPMLDREEAVAHFRDLLDPATPLRIMRLLGEAKMGKTHLLTKVFPELALQQAVRCAVLDLRNKQQTIIIHLNNTCAQLGWHYFPDFVNAYKDWVSRPDIEMHRVSMILSFFSARIRDRDDDTNRMI